MTRRLLYFLFLILPAVTRTDEIADRGALQRDIGRRLSGGPLKNRYEWDSSPQASARACARCVVRGGVGETESDVGEGASYDESLPGSQKSNGDRLGRAATIILASGSTGGTWLGQLLHLHPCTNSFRLKVNTNEDGKFRGFDSLQRLASIFYDMQPGTTAASRKTWQWGPRGVIVSAPQIERLKRAPVDHTLNLPSHLKEDGIRIIVLARDPLFWAVSRAKKRSLLGPDGIKMAKKLGCANRHQRGGEDCKNINATYRFRVDPEDFYKIYEENAQEYRTMLHLAQWLGNMFRPGGTTSGEREGRKKGYVGRKVNPHKKGKGKGKGKGTAGVGAGGSKPKQRSLFRIARYEDILCHSERSLGAESLPPQLLAWIGLGKCTIIPTVQQPGSMSPSSVKSSPDNPLSAIANMKDVQRWAKTKAKRNTPDFNQSKMVEFRAALENRLKLQSQTRLSEGCVARSDSEVQDGLPKIRQTDVNAFYGVDVVSSDTIGQHQKVDKKGKKDRAQGATEPWELGTMGDISAAIAKQQIQGISTEVSSRPVVSSPSTAAPQLQSIRAQVPQPALPSWPQTLPPQAQPTPRPTLRQTPKPLSSYGELNASQAYIPVGNDAAPAGGWGRSTYDVQLKVEKAPPPTGTTDTKQSKLPSFSQPQEDEFQKLQREKFRLREAQHNAATRKAGPGSGSGGDSSGRRNRRSGGPQATRRKQIPKRQEFQKLRRSFIGED